MRLHRRGSWFDTRRELKAIAWAVFLIDVIAIGLGVLAARSMGPQAIVVGVTLAGLVTVAFTLIVIGNLIMEEIAHRLLSEASSTPRSFRARALRYVTDNPFLILGIFSATVGVLGAAPAGWDYDPDPTRNVLRVIFVLTGVPFWLIGSLLLSLPPRFMIPLGMALGLIPYVLLDVVRRRRRAHRAPGD